MDLALLEGEAVAEYKRLGFDPATPVSTFTLARRRLGPDAIIKAPTLVGAQATTVLYEGRKRIGVSQKLPLAYQRFLVGHELAHDIFAAQGHTSDEIEAECDALGAMLMAPMPAVLAMWRAFGSDYASHADEAGSTETWAALRLAEVLRCPRAILTPQRVYVRGPEEFVWPEEQAIRSLARGRLRPGLKRARLGDDPRRVVIDVEETGTE